MRHYLGRSSLQELVDAFVRREFGRYGVWYVGRSSRNDYYLFVNAEWVLINTTDSVLGFNPDAERAHLNQAFSLLKVPLFVTKKNRVQTPWGVQPLFFAPFADGHDFLPLSALMAPPV